MKSQVTLHRLSVFTMVLILAACSEDEEACYDKISADLKKTAEWASKSGHHERALQAHESVISALVILSDDDRSVCDYVTADVYLQRK